MTLRVSTTPAWWGWLGNGDLLKVAADELQGLLAPHAERTSVRYLSPAQPRVTA
ncbi:MULTISPECIES: hypothetical protein [Streptomyces]|uniref:hypothetical protein n=1 Tax=Streptomyces TaxID=1883 RepID=UPI0029B66BD1|nr:hypothetical protein [Streptomyces sp. WI03-4A]MDX2597413.1 hypothetical protein [Streptomyces sp. WI03-4A]